MAGTTVLRDMANYLANQSTSWIAGTNLFAGFLPDKPNTCIALIEVLGFEPPAETMGGSDVNVERPQIQVVSRSEQMDYETARTNSKWAYKTLRNKLSTALGSTSGTHYLAILPRTSPYYQGEDDNARHVITFTLDVWKEPST